MSYALYLRDTRISPVFRAKEDAWRHAEQQGAVEVLMSSEDDPPRQRLRLDHSIRIVDDPFIILPQYAVPAGDLPAPRL